MVTSVFYSANLLPGCSVAIHVFWTFQQKKNYSRFLEKEKVCDSTVSHSDSERTTSSITFSSEGNQAQEAHQSQTKKQQAHTSKHTRNAHHAHSVMELKSSKTSLDTHFQHHLSISTLSLLSTSLLPLLLSSCLPSSFNPLHFRFHSFHFLTQPTAEKVFIIPCFIIPSIYCHLLLVKLLCLPTFSS